MINREKLIEEIAGVINRNSLEKAFNDTPDFVLALVAVEAIEMFTRASAHRDDYHNLERRITTGNIKPFAKAKKQSP